MSGARVAAHTRKVHHEEVMVERSMYLDDKSAGTDTIGGFSN